jgi:TolB-like protein
MKVAEDGQHVYAFGPFRLDVAARALLRGDTVVPLLPKSFETLAVLVRNYGKLLDKDVLMGSVWQDAVVEENSLAKAISDVRKALGDWPKHQRYIVTVPGRGYRFAATVTTVASAPQTHSIAVRPFTTMTGQPADEFLGVGLADALITRLSRAKRILVRPTSAVLRFDGATKDAASIARELDVDWLLDGTVRRAGDRIRVSVQLVKTPTGATAWADTFDETFTDLFAVEDTISRRIVAALAVRLTGAEEQLLARHQTDRGEAYELYLKGRFFWTRRTPDAIDKAIDYFERAIASDPNYALAYAGLADAYIILGLQSAVMGGRRPTDTCPKAQTAVVKALQLDDALAEAHTSLGHIKFSYQWDWTGAEECFITSTGLNPHYAHGRNAYAIALMFCGRTDEALTQIREARRLDPLSTIINTTYGWLLYYSVAPTMRSCSCGTRSKWIPIPRSRIIAWDLPSRTRGCTTRLSTSS